MELTNTQSAVYEAIRSSIGEDGYSTATDADLAVAAGVSTRTVRNALAALRDKKLVFSRRDGGYRRLSLVTSPRIDREAVLERLVDRIRSVTATGSDFFEGRKKTAKALRVSEPVLRDVYQLGESKGVLRRRSISREGKDGLRLLEGWEVIGQELPTEEASPSLRAEAEPPQTIALDALLADIQAENERLRSRLAAVEDELSHAQQACYEAEERLAAYEAQESNVASLDAYRLQRQAEELEEKYQSLSDTYVALFQELLAAKNIIPDYLAYQEQIETHVAANLQGSALRRYQMMRRDAASVGGEE